jgi:hypothetical protein
VLATSAAAQEETALIAPADLYRDPEGAPLVSLPAGASVETGRARDGWHQAVVEGWIFTASTERTRREGYDLVVTAGDGENLRASPNGPVVGRAREGTLLKRVAQRGRWTHVRRSGWLPRQAVAARSADRSRTVATADSEAAARTVPVPGAQQPAPRQPAASQATPPGSTPRSGPTGASGKSKGTATGAPPGPPIEPAGGVRFRLARETSMAAAAEGGALGTLTNGAPARLLARAGDQVKIQVEGWVPADAVSPADDSAMVGVTAAEVRSQPDQFVGRTVVWRLQVIAVRQADELRGEMPPGQTYLLTRGPLPEPGFVYLTIPAAQSAAFQALPPLAEIVARVSIRAARTKFLTTPVAELVSVVSGMDGK